MTRRWPWPARSAIPPCWSRSAGSIASISRLTVQYLYWVGGVLSGNLGESMRLKEPVLTLIKQKFPVTLQLALMAIVFSLAIGVTAGVISAVKQQHAASTMPSTWWRCGASRRRTSGSASC